MHRIQKEVRTVLQNHTFQSKYEQLSYQEYVRELILIGLDSSDARKSTAAAISRGLPILPIGIMEKKPSFIS